MSTSRETLVICFSTEGFKADIWTNKQHLMSRLANRKGYEVCYVDQGMSSRGFKRAIKKLDWEYFFKPIWKFNKKLTCLSFYFLPLIKGGIFKRLSWQLVYYFLQVWKDEKKYDRIIIWTYQPQSWYYLKKTDNRSDDILILYDCVDDFKSQPFYAKNPKRRQELDQIETNLVQKADIVTTTSEKLHEDKKQLNNNTHYIHNVGDYEHFNSPSGPLSQDLSFLSTIEKKKIGYAGVIDDYKIDLELIDQVTNTEELYFQFFGPVRVKENVELLKKIENKRNVTFYGYLDYEILPSALHACDAIWLPYQSNEHTKYVFPLKLFEAFATGKQVIARDLISYNKYKDYMQVFNNADQAREELLKEPNLELADKRKNLAKANSWDSRLDKILNLINKN